MVPNDYSDYSDVSFGVLNCPGASTKGIVDALKEVWMFATNSLELGVPVQPLSISFHTKPRTVFFLCFFVAS